MKKILAAFVLLLGILSGCEESESAQFSLEGTIEGEVRTINELGIETSDQANVQVQLRGEADKVLLSTTTDEEGKYVLKHIPSGTYNMVITKDGYGEFQNQGIMVVGGDEPLFINGSLFEKSKTIITDLSASTVSSNQLILKGLVFHYFSVADLAFNRLGIMCFFHTDKNPSSDNYLQAGMLYFNGESGSYMENSLYLNKDYFPPGSDVYIVAYGSMKYYWGYYDIKSNQNRYTSIGQPSNIAHVTLPD